ncbi:DMT family transporter [Roseimaritima ulvae]|uniref:Inner membrane protein YdcZ n=1 Tax=Roseimaritima ulvae TaxID=980254 RepID=A0A5B9QWS5_9BACT|nr:DMT family transporter [Roseimaritima ulvae]QEG38403.1 hypothetical protein UC8_03600 [Roseimaritima ulvae]
MFQNQSLLLVAVVVGLLAGCLLGTQPSANGYLGRHLAHPLQAAVISFGSGFVILLVLSIANGVFPPRFSTPPTGLPWWVWSGGAIGTVLVTTSLIFVPRIGSLTWFAAVITGQVLAALILDQWGMMGNPRSPASPLRLLGAAMLIGGILLITRAKALESRPGKATTVEVVPAESVDDP